MGESRTSKELYERGGDNIQAVCHQVRVLVPSQIAGQVPLMELPRERKEIHEASQAALQLYVQSRDKEGRLTEKPGDLSGSV